MDVDRRGEVWLYRPESHKTEHRGHDRVIPIGPRGQEILRPYLLRKDTQPCYSPAEAYEQHRRRRTLQRKTPVSRDPDMSCF